ncbi:MAG: leucyl aminopeptidase [Candidatus Micrarchaeia archaeon]
MTNIKLLNNPMGTPTYVEFCYSKDKKPVLEGSLKKYSENATAKGFGASLGEYFIVNDGLILVGLGEKGNFKPRFIRKAIFSALGFVKALRIATVALMLKQFDEIITKNAVYSAYMTEYEFDKFRSKEEKKEKGKLEQVQLIIDEKFNQAMREVVEVSESINYARTICNTPANVASPQYMAEEARKLAKECLLKCSVLTKKDMEKKGMNALLAVAAGSAREPVMPILEYSAKNAKKTIVVVGKGITFDSGGISLKPSKGMDEMKFDKSGACAVLGIMRAVSKLRPNVNVVGVLPCTDNMPSGSATRPGDIVKAYNGKTIEILNTDAEGRLILADAIAYAEDKYKPDYIIDLATLTGACIVALGVYAMGMLSNDDSFANTFKEASNASFDELWQLPLWDEYKDMMKSKVADIKNISDTGEAGTITGAAFISNFVSKAKWVHLDIAGTAHRSKPVPPFDHGASGSGISVVIEAIKMIEKVK